MAKELMESGNLYFFYRPKIHEERVRELDDVQRFYLVMAPDELRLFRLLIIVQKYLPWIIPGKMAPEERNWAIVDLVTEDGRKLARETWLGGECRVDNNIPCTSCRGSSISTCYARGPQRTGICTGIAVQTWSCSGDLQYPA